MRRYTAQEARDCLAHRRVLLMGDSVSRYQVASHEPRAHGARARFLCAHAAARHGCSTWLLVPLSRRVRAMLTCNDVAVPGNGCLVESRVLPIPPRLPGPHFPPYPYSLIRCPHLPLVQYWRSTTASSRIRRRSHEPLSFASNLSGRLRATVGLAMRPDLVAVCVRLSARSGLR